MSRHCVRLQAGAIEKQPTLRTSILPSVTMTQKEPTSGESCVLSVHLNTTHTHHVGHVRDHIVKTPRCTQDTSVCGEEGSKRQVLSRNYSRSDQKNWQKSQEEKVAMDASRWRGATGDGTAATRGWLGTHV